MLIGTVNEQGGPLVEVALDLGPACGRVATQAVIDTGFNGYISVPVTLLESATGASPRFQKGRATPNLLLRLEPR